MFIDEETRAQIIIEIPPAEKRIEVLLWIFFIAP